MSTLTPAKVYASVKDAVKAGASVTAEDLETANAYAKKAKRGAIKDAKVKVVRNTKNAGVKCKCGEPAVAKGMCMTDYIREYRTDDANRERANAASRKYAAKKRAEKAAAKA